MLPFREFECYTHYLGADKICHFKGRVSCQTLDRGSDAKGRRVAEVKDSEEWRSKSEVPRSKRGAGTAGILAGGRSGAQTVEQLEQPGLTSCCCWP